MRGGDVDQSGRRWDGLDDDAVIVDRNPDHLQALTAEQCDHRWISRFLDGDHIAGSGQHSGDQIDGVPGTGGDEDGLGGGCDTSGAGHPAGQGGTKLGRPGGLAVAGGASVHRAPEAASPGDGGKQRGVQPAGPEVEPGTGSGIGIPEGDPGSSGRGPQADAARSDQGRGRRTADDAPTAGSPLDVPLGGQPAVCLGHGRAGDTELRGHGSRWAEPVALGQPALTDGVSELVVQLHDARPAVVGVEEQLHAAILFDLVWSSWPRLDL